MHVDGLLLSLLLFLVMNALGLLMLTVFMLWLVGVIVVQVECMGEV